MTEHIRVLLERQNHRLVEPGPSNDQQVALRLPHDVAALFVETMRRLDDHLRNGVNIPHYEPGEAAGELRVLMWDIRDLLRKGQPYDLPRPQSRSPAAYAVRAAAG